MEGSGTDTSSEAGPSRSPFTPCGCDGERILDIVFRPLGPGIGLGRCLGLGCDAGLCAGGGGGGGGAGLILAKCDTGGFSCPACSVLAFLMILSTASI